MTRVLLFLVLWTIPPAAWAGPDLPGALRTLIGAPLVMMGDAGGGLGLIGASLIATSGDVVSLVDDNRATAPILGGALSTGIQRIGLGLSGLSTGLLEGLRGEDVERLPEPPEHYLDTEPGFGRLDTALSGFGALRLAILDTLSAPLLFGSQLAGASTLSERLEHWRHEARVNALGPDPAP